MEHTDVEYMLPFDIVHIGLGHEYGGLRGFWISGDENTSVIRFAHFGDVRIDNGYVYPYFVRNR